MARTYRDIAIEDMLGTVQEAMSQAIDWWGDLPTEMKESIDQFRTELGAAIDSVEFVKKALSRQVHETDHGSRAREIATKVTSRCARCTVMPSTWSAM